MKFWKKILLQIGIWQVKPKEELVERLKESMYVEEQSACDHKMLSALFPSDRWYRCTNCNEVWFIVDADVIKANKIKTLAKKLNEIANTMPQNKTKTKLKDMK